MIKKEAADKHEKCDCADDDVEIAPSHIHGFGTARLARSGNRAGGKVRVTFVISEEAPGDERADKLTEGPPDGEKRQKPLGRRRDEFQE